MVCRQNDKKIKNYKVWQEGSDAKEINSNEFLDEKMEYIHNNPVRAEIVANPVDYLYPQQEIIPVKKACNNVFYLFL